MDNKKELEYLMRLNKERLNNAEHFIKILGDDANVNYWEGVKFTAIANVRALQSFGISTNNEDD